MAFITKAFTTTCPGDLIVAINGDPALNGAVCFQIIDTNDGNTTFEFDRPLTGPEDSALDSLLAGWTCPIEPPPGDGNETVNDSAPPSTETIWTSDKTNTEITNASNALDTAKADKVSPVVDGNIAGLDSNGNLTDSGFAASDFAPVVHTHVEADITDLDRTQWEGNYVETQYQKNDMVNDVGWLMVANKDTGDRAAPMPSGDPVYSLPDTPVWTYLANTSVVHSGTEFTFTEGGWLQRVRVWVPTLSSSTNYRFVIADITDPAVPLVRFIPEPILFEDEWTDIVINNYVVSAGTVLIAYVDALNSGSNSNITGGWEYDGTSQNSGPGNQGWNTTNQGSTVRIDKDDLDSVDRTTELLGVVPGSTILCSQTNDNDRYAEFLVLLDPIDAGDYVQYAVVTTDAGDSLQTGQANTINIEVPIAQSTDYVTTPGYWSTNPPSFATVKGVLRFDGVAQTGVENDAFGIDVQFQKAYVSPDWDFMSLSGTTGSGGGGGGGGGIGEAPEDGTPYSRQDALWVPARTSLSDLDDVDNALTPTANQILVWDDFNSYFVAQDPTFAVDSVFGRTGVVVAQSGDYSSTLIGNLSNLSGTTVTDALNTVNTHIIDNSIHYTKASINLSDLGNVNAAAPNSTDILQWNGSEWVNAPNTQGGDLATVTASRGSNFVLPTAGSFNDIPFDQTDIENDSTVIEHDPANNDRFLIKETGTYGIAFSMTATPAGASVSDFISRVRTNDTTEIPGSRRSMSEDGEPNDMSNYFTADLTTGDFITMQVQGSIAGDAVFATSNFSVTRLKGTKGDQGEKGDTGTGSTIMLKEEGVGLPGQFDTLNFTGSVTVTDAGSQEATIDVTGGGGGGGPSGSSFFADGFQTPVTTDWQVNAFAPITVDPNNLAMLVRAFDDSTDEGVGFPLFIPAGVTSINVTYKGRPSASSSSSVNFRVAGRLVPNNASMPAWNANMYTQTLTMNGNANYATWTGSFTLASASITAGETYLFELFRRGGADGLTGDFFLYEYTWEFV